MPRSNAVSSAAGERLVETLRTLRGRLHQNVPGMRALERRARESVADRDVVRHAPDQFETGHARAEPLARDLKQFERAFGA